MNSKQRVIKAFNHELPDRVPIDYEYNADIDRRLKKHFSLAQNDNEGLRKALGVDFRKIWPEYTAPPLHEQLSDRKINEWGSRKRWIEHETGGYWDYCDFPLKDADYETIENWPMPCPDNFDYESVKEFTQTYSDYYIVLGSPGIGDIINSTGMLRTMEQVLIDLAMDEPAGLFYIDRKFNTMVEIAARALETAKGKIDMLFIGEDLGTQIGPILSIDMFRKHIRPHHQKLVDIANEYNARVMIHSCGSSSWAFNDFIEMGITVIDTLQPEAADMSPEYLKKTFGSKLSFHGCISTAGPVATGTVDDVVADVRSTLEIMMPGGGYALAPTHQLQDNSPTENVVAMYQAAAKYGCY
jgi:uroporphyrinogen decarboxylase